MTRLVTEQGGFCSSGLGPSTTDSSREPDYSNQRDDPRRKKRERHSDHTQTPHDCARALRNSSAYGRDETGVGRNNVALTINLDRQIGRRVGFVDLSAAAVLALDAHVFNFAQRVERLDERVVILHWDAQCDIRIFPTVRIAAER